MASIDGAIGMKIHINLPQTTDVNISKGQPSRANGLGGVVTLRSKSPTISYKYRKRINLFGGEKSEGFRDPQNLCRKILLPRDIFEKFGSAMWAP